MWEDGDKIRCIDGSKQKTLELGKVYTVDTSMNTTEDRVYIKENKRKEIVEFDEKCGGWYVHKQADILADVLFKQHNEEWQIKQNYTPSIKHKVRIIGNIYENHELT